MAKRSFIVFSACFLLAPLILFPLWRFALKARPQYLSLPTIPFDPIHDLGSTSARPLVWLDGQDWEFQREGDRVWQAGMTVPAGWNLIRGLESWDGRARYRKRFTLPPGFRPSHTVLHFRGVLYRAQVFLNGAEMGSHEGGYTSFSFDVTSALKPEAENLLEVVVENRLSLKTLPGRIKGWRHGGGIYREVYLEGIPETAIADIFIQAEPDQGQGRVLARVSLTNFGSQPKESSLHLMVSPPSGGPRAEVSKGVKIASGAREQPETLALELEHVTPWSPDHPVLYQARVSLGGDGDERKIVFGFKRLEARGRKLFLNGEPLKIRGLSRHEDVPGTFRTQTLPALEKDLRLIKALGANTLRLGHYPNHPAILDLCDRYGLLVWEESPTWGSQSPDYGAPEVMALGVRQTEEMIRRDRNHVSVGFWGVANEIPTDRKAGAEFVRACVEAGRRLAHAQLFTAASFLGERDQSIACLDVASFNAYQGWYHGYPEDFRAYLDHLKTAFPGKPILISEYGADAQSGWHGAYGDIYTEENQARTLAMRFRMIEDDPDCAGGLIWIFADFMDDMRLLNPRPFFNQKGLVDYDRREKLAYRVVGQLYHAPEREVPIPGQSRILPRVLGAALAALTLVMLFGSLASRLPRTWLIFYPESPNYRRLLRRAFWMSAVAALYLFLVSRIGLLSQPLAIWGPDLITLRILRAILNSSLSPAFAFYGCLWLWLLFASLAGLLGKILRARPRRSALEITLGVGDPLAWILPYSLVLLAPPLLGLASGAGVWYLTGSWRNTFSTIPSFTLAAAFCAGLVLGLIKTLLAFRAGFRIGIFRSGLLVLFSQLLTMAALVVMVALI